MARIGVVGAGRVGAVLSAALRAAGHEIVAAGADSPASLHRAETLLPGVPVAKPTDVARACDLLLLTVPDDMLSNVVTTLVVAGAIREGQVVCHTSGRHGLDVLAPATAIGARPIAMHPAMTFTGTEIDLDRLSGLAHGANHLVTLVSQAMELLAASGAEDPAATLRPLLSAALDNALASGDAALTGPIVRGDVRTVQAHLDDITENAPATIPSYVAMAKATADRAVLDGRLLPIRAARLVRMLDEALVRVGETSALPQRAPGAQPGRRRNHRSDTR
jgi:predicted short-subunit dehydrogenase-like oxidoreductase (DUF2520 family)